MGKSELLDVILRDIKELELITQGMREMEKVPAVMRDLAKTKALNIYDGFCHINEASSQVFSDQLQKTIGIEVPSIHAQETISTPPCVSSPSDKKESMYKEADVVAECVVEPKIPEPVKVETVEKQEDSVSLEMEVDDVTTEQEIQNIEEKIEPQAQKEIGNDRDSESEHYPYSEKNKELDKKGTVIANVSNGPHTSITNERFKPSVKSLNETVSVGRKPEGRFVNSLKKAINLNDRFRYKKDLFGGDADLMNKTIDTLEEMESFDRAMEYLLSQFSWDLNSQAAGDFVAMLEARFS